VIAFEPLGRSDFPLLATWLAEPLVARWWNQEHSPEALEREFGPSIDGEDETEIFIATEDRPYGLIQRYPIGAYAEYRDELAAVCDVPAGALSIDYLIGEPSARGRGRGAAMIAAFVGWSWRRYPEARDVIVPVAAANRGSWRALERAGFERVATGELEPDNPRDSREHHVYRISRVP
jgi:aminoglycoside 6'-N-acetyltransferase